MDKSGRSDGYVLLPNKNSKGLPLIRTFFQKAQTLRKSLAEMEFQTPGTSEPVFLVAGV